MELQIKNFGPIKKGKIDLSKKFDLFVGYNNSGKTYVSQMLWAIFHRSTIKNFVGHLIKKEKNILPSESVGDKYEINKNFIDNLLREYSDYIITETIPKIFNIKKDHFILNECSIKFILEDIKRIKESEIRSKTIMGVNFAEESEKKEFKLFEIEKKKNSLTVEIKENELDEDFFDHIPKKVFSQTFDKKKALNKTILSSVLQSIFKDERPFYLPASRLFYPVFYEYLFKYEKERREEMSEKLLDMFSSDRKLEEKDFPRYKSRYTVPMDALMSKIYSLNIEMPDTSEYHDIFSKELENIIGGKILLGRREGLAPTEFFLNLENQDNNLEMYLSSSSVNQLTTLYLFFKYWAEKDENYLIIDEPEENLHPENQVSLINLMVKFAKKGKQGSDYNTQPFISQSPE